MPTIFFVIVVVGGRLVIHRWLAVGGRRYRIQTAGHLESIKPVPYYWPNYEDSRETTGAAAVIQDDDGGEHTTRRLLSFREGLEPCEGIASLRLGAPELRDRQLVTCQHDGLRASFRRAHVLVLT